MATRKKQQPENKNETLIDERKLPAVLPLQRIEALLEWSAGPRKIRPWLIGESGAGKTTFIRKFAERTGRHLEVLLLSSMLPEDVLGLPRVVQGKTIWSRPEWLQKVQKQPSVLLLDEIDKARDETIGVVLTLLWDFHVRGEQLRDDTILVLASQPVPPSFRASETGTALIERSVWIPISAAPATAAGRLLTRALPVLGSGYGIFDLPVEPSLSARRADGLGEYVTRAHAAEWPLEEIACLVAGAIPPKHAIEAVKPASTETDILRLLVLEDPRALMSRATIEQLIGKPQTLIGEGIPLRYYIHYFCAAVRIDPDGHANAFQEWVSSMQYGDTVMAGEEDDTVESVSKEIERAAAWLLEESEKFGGLREATPEVLQEQYLFIVERDDSVKPEAEAPLAWKKEEN